jgi:flagellar biosynthesis chaperone FliJ
VVQIKELAAKQIKLRTVVDQLQETRDKAAAALAKLRDSFETMAAKNKQLREDNDDMKAQIAVLKQRADINETPASSAN